jgi:hypothetical protein
MDSIPLCGSFLVAYNHQFLSDVLLHSCLIATHRTHHFPVDVTNNRTLGISVKLGEEGCQ